MRPINFLLGFVFIFLDFVFADETCQSPYMPKVVGQEDYVYVWTLGDPEVGDGSDKLVVIDVNPKSKTFGKVVHYVSVGGRHESRHHCGIYR
ncbi:MAG: selenium-binding protein SBP56-related protein [Aquificota bacterium]|nr:selenium-binding protein SBP56-related protein [Aquificota bacterium]